MERVSSKSLTSSWWDGEGTRSYAMSPVVCSITDVVQLTSRRDREIFRGPLGGGVGLEIIPRLGNVHEADTSLLEFPLLLLGFPDGVDIGSEAEKGETLRRLPLDLLGVDGDGADERGGGEQDGGND